MTEISALFSPGNITSLREIFSRALVALIDYHAFLSSNRDRASVSVISAMREQPEARMPEGGGHSFDFTSYIRGCVESFVMQENRKFLISNGRSTILPRIVGDTRVEI